MSPHLEALGVRTADLGCLLEAKERLLEVQEVTSEETWIEFRLEQLDIVITNTGE